MEGKRRVTSLATAVLLILAGTAFASGFNIYEAGARATALGGAFTATADDGSALFYNAAGIAFLEGTTVDLNIMPILPDAKFTGATPPEPAATGQTTDQTFPIPGAYFTTGLGETVTGGIGIYAPFGLGVEWADPESWVGRHSSYDVDLATIYVTGAVAFRLHERAAVAFGVDMAHSKITLKKFSAIEFGPLSDVVDVIDSKLEGSSDLNVTPTFGLLLHPHHEVSLGLMFHAPKVLDFNDGDVTLTNVAPALLADTIDDQIALMGGTEQKVSTKVKLPGFFSLGIAYQILERARLEFNAVRFLWSHFDKIVLDFVSPTNPDQTILERYQDIWQLRFGLDVDVADNLKAMFGYIHDNSPQPTESVSPLLPDANREDFSVGLQWRGEKLTLTASYMAVLFHDRSNVVDGQIVRFDETQPAGTYDSVANIFGAGVGYRF